MHGSLPGSSVYGILQAWILRSVAIPFSSGSSWPKDWNPGLLHCRQILYRLSHQGSPYIYVLFSKKTFEMYKKSLERFKYNLLYFWIPCSVIIFSGLNWEKRAIECWEYVFNFMFSTLNFCRKYVNFVIKIREKQNVKEIDPKNSITNVGKLLLFSL